MGKENAVKEERMKILEMLQDGKITAEEAMKLLEALGDAAEEPQRQTRRRQRQRNRQGGAGIQEEVQERVREARETLRASMPKVKNAVREAMPDVGSIIQEAMQTASDAFSEWTEKSDRQPPKKAVRQLVETIQASDRLSIATPKGHVASEIWDRDEVQVEATISVWGTEEPAVNAFAEQIDIHIQRESGKVQIRPRVPKRAYLVVRDGQARGVQIPRVPKRERDDPVRSVRIDFALRHPKKVDLAVRAAHGNITLPEIDGAATLNNHRGKTIFEGASGNVRIKQHRGDIAVQRAGGDLSLDAHRSEMRVGTAAGSVTVHAHHGTLAIDHVGGEFLAENSRGSIKAARVDGRAVVKNRRGNIALRNVGSEVAVENGRGATHLENIAGPISLRVDRGDIAIENPEAGVAIQSRGGRVAVRAHKPIDGDYAIQNKQGAIELAIPEGSAVDVHGYVGRGQIKTDLPLSVTDTSRTSQVVSGRLNGGGSKIALELNQGNLILRSDEGVEGGDEAKR